MLDTRIYINIAVITYRDTFINKSSGPYGHLLAISCRKRSPYTAYISTMLAIIEKQSQTLE